jgi:hypothetical protein
MASYILTPTEALTWDCAYVAGTAAPELSASLFERFGSTVVDHEHEATTTVYHPDGFVVCFLAQA